MKVTSRHRLVFAAAVLAGVWWAVAAAASLAILPGPGRVMAAFVRGLAGDLGLHAGASLFRVCCSIVLAVGLAAPLGLVLGQNAAWRRWTAPFIYLLYPLPKVVFVPVVMLLFGVGNLPKILLVALILFFQVLVLVRDHAAGVRPELVRSVRSLGAGGLDLLRFVYVPACVPAVLSAVRQSIGTAVSVLYLAELIATDYGLGYYIHLNANTLLDFPNMYAGILAMALLGLGLFAGIDRLEQRFCRWCRSDDEGGPSEP